MQKAHVDTSALPAWRYRGAFYQAAYTALEVTIREAFAASWSRTLAHDRASSDDLDLVVDVLP